MGMFGNSTSTVLAWPKYFRAARVRVNKISIAEQQLDSLLKEADAVLLRSKNLIAGREHSVLNTSFGEGAWSVAQCFDHLAQTTNAFLPEITNAISGAPRLNRNRELKVGALTQVIIQNLEPPYKLRFKVLKALVPQRDNFQQAWEAFEDSQAALETVIETARGLAIDKMKIESPVYARLNYNVYGALRMLMAHQRRHLWQIEQILKALDSNQ